MYCAILWLSGMEADMRKYRLGLIAVMVSSFLLKVYCLALTAEIPLVLDERIYFRYALKFLSGQGLVGTNYPPLYRLFLAGAIFLLGESIWKIKFVQIVLSTINVWILFLLGEELFDRRVALVGALLFSFYPTLIGFTHYLWSETLFIFLLSWAFYLLVRFASIRRRGYLVGGGALLGLSALTRSVVFFSLPFLVLWLFLVHRRGIRSTFLSALLLTSSCLLVVVPWTVRNYRRYHDFIFIETNWGYVLWKGNNRFVWPFGGNELNYPGPFGSYPIFYSRASRDELIARCEDRYQTSRLTAAQLNECAAREALDYILEEPLAFLARARTKMAILWHPTSFVIRHFVLGFYGERDKRWVSVVTWLVYLSYLLVMITGTVGFLYSNDDNRLLFLMLVGYWCLVHSISISMNRYRLPLMPFIMLYSGYAIANWREIYRRVFPGVERKRAG